MSNDEYLESVLARLTHGEPSLPLGMIGTTIMQQKGTALQRTAEFVAGSDNPATQSLLQKTWPVLTLVSGEVAKPTDALTMALRDAQIIVSDGGSTIFPEPAEWIGTVYDLLNPPPILDYVFFTCHNGLLKFRQYTANGIVTPTMNGTDLNKVDVTGNYVPTLAGIALTDDVADILFDSAVALFNESQMSTEVKAEVN